MTKMKFGCQLPQDTSDIDQVLETAELCESLGYDSIWTYDHLAPFWLDSKSCLEGWSLLSAVAARTSKIKVGSLVTNVNLRNPALLAKIAATVDNISHGRLILGLGVGDRLSVEELRSYGYRFPPLNERLTLLRETIMLLRDLWTKDTVSYKGELVNVSDTVCRPKPIQNGGPPIWIGGRHTAIIDIVAELADGWNHWGLDKQKQAERETHLDTRCGLVGRDPSRIVESWAGSMPTIYGNSRNLAEAMKSRLKTEVGQRTHYFIASFPTEADHNAYQSFADAVKSLD